jgi:hypothetical protein
MSPEKWVTAPTFVNEQQEQEPWSVWDQLVGSWNGGNTRYYRTGNLPTPYGRPNWQAISGMTSNPMLKLHSDGITTNALFGLGELLFQLNNLLDPEVIRKIVSYVQELIARFVEFIGEPFTLSPARESERIRARLMPVVEAPSVTLALSDD